MTRRSFIVEADGTMRDAEHRLVGENHQEVLVRDIGSIPGAVLQLVQLYWPDATPVDVQWSTPPQAWDGTNELRWSTCAEIDGTVRRVPATGGANG
jgi:hypothetical protein